VLTAAGLLPDADLVDAASLLPDADLAAANGARWNDGTAPSRRRFSFFSTSELETRLFARLPFLLNARRNSGDAPVCSSRMDLSTRLH
jgi:hypothetical protein